MKNTDDIWHYARIDLAEKYLDLLKIGITHRITLFAPRRMGKTEFIVLDLAKIAKKRKYLPIYISLWAEPNEPHKSIIRGLESAIDELKSNRSTLTRLFSATVSKLKIEGNMGLGKLTAEVEFPDNAISATSNELFKISKLFKELVTLSKKRRPIILLDEIQHLGSSKKFESLTYALRTALDIHGRHFDVIFTGSSRLGLRKMFSDTKAPFYEFSDRIEFPRLDARFIDHLASVYKVLVKKEMSTKQMWKIFKEIDYNPAYLRSILKVMILENNDDMSKVYTRVLDAVAQERDYPSQWKEIRVIDREVYMVLSKGRSLYSEKTMIEIGNRIGLEIGKPKIQSSVRRLVKMQLISPDGHGKYLIEAPGFTQWCLNQEKLN